MEIKITNKNKVKIAEIVSDNIEVKNAQDALEIFGNCVYQGASKIIFYKKNIIPDLFDLKIGRASCRERV